MRKKAQINFEVGVSAAQPLRAVAEDEIFSEDKVFLIHLSNVIPSPFEPQARRRAKFNESELRSLGQSIKRFKLKQPIVVRPSREFAASNNLQVYEIVFGERRWRASQLAGLENIKCFVEDYTDAEVIELQYEENHRRQKSDPLDDAYIFQYLKEKENYSDEDLADRLATTIQNVREKLKLNDLIEQAKSELSDGRLPLRHAYYLARFPLETQREIVEAQYAYRYNDRDEKAVSFEMFRDEVEENILRRLIDSPFDVADPRLHVRGLLCRDCPENSAFATHLFPELAQEPRCLNKACFQIKANTHLRLQREEIAARRPNPANVSIEEIEAAVPLVTERKYTSDRVPFREKVLVNQELLEKPECEFSESAVAVEGEKKGASVYVCRNDDCPVHHPKPILDDMPEEELNRMETDFDERVASRVRLKILKAAMEWFDDRRTFWMFDDLIKNLIVECLFESSAGRHAEILQLVGDWKNAPRNFNDNDRLRAFAGDLDKTRQSQLLFLLSAMNAEDLELTKILKDYTTLNFFHLDAEVRFELAPTEFKQPAAEYLAAVKDGRVCDVPRFWRNFDDVRMISGEEN